MTDVKAKAPAKRPGKERSKGSSKATEILALAAKHDLFHAPDGTPYASIQVRGHLETHPVGARAYRDILAHTYYENTKGAPPAQAMREAIDVIAAKARIEGRQQAVFLRIGEAGGAIYLDLARQDWKLVKVTAEGWHLADSADCPEVRFRRRHGMVPLPIPVAGGDLTELWRFANVAEEDRPLVLGWLVAALNPRGPYAILTFTAEQGSAKSTTSRALRRLVDPNAADLRAEPRELRDLVVAARGSWILAFDNLSHVTPQLADALCRISTGDGFSTRTLYTDEEETIFQHSRPVLLNGIEALATRPDLLDRAVVLELPPIPEHKRRDERTFWQEFEEARPRLVGKLLDGVACALRELPRVDLASKPRMADFAMWATAAEVGLGLPAGAFMSAYDRLRESANESAIEMSRVASAIRDLAAQGDFEGTATDLLTRISEPIDKPLLTELRRAREWPTGAKQLANALRRCAANLRALGILVDFGRDSGRARRRLIRIRQKHEAGAPRSAQSASSGLDGGKEDRPDRADGGDLGVVAAAAPGEHADGSDHADGPPPTLDPSLRRAWEMFERDPYHFGTGSTKHGRDGSGGGATGGGGS